MGSSLCLIFEKRKIKISMLESKQLFILAEIKLYIEKDRNIEGLFFSPKILKKVDTSMQISFGIQCNDPIVNIIQSGVTSSTVELSSGAPCHLCLFQTPLRILFTSMRLMLYLCLVAVPNPLLP